MKKLLVLFLAFLIILSCQKNEPDTIPVQQVAEVQFNAIQINPVGSQKSTDEWLCPTDPVTGELLEPTYAKVIIDGFVDDPFWVEVFVIDGNLYTQAIKLPVAGDDPETYTVNFFGLYTEYGGTLIMATPSDGSHYSEYTAPDVNFTFEVNKFAKEEVPVEVLCYMPDDYDNFGFDWYQVTEIIIREQCFFGDICADDPDLFINSLYNSQMNGVQIDMPAIFYIDVTLDGEPVPYSPFGNTSWFGEGAPLCVEYPDNQSIDGEEFVFELYILLPDDQGEFNYQLYQTWTFEDAEMIPTGGDGIVEFVIGDCNLIPPDITFPPLAPVPPPDPAVPTCETAYAYGDTFANCFFNIPNLQGNRWGWTNGELREDSYTFEIYAAAGQCDLSKGTLVGTLSVDYSGGSAAITYSMNAGYTMYSVHLFAGNEILPRDNKGEFTTAPGQCPVVEEFAFGETTFSHTFTGLSGEIYVVAHAVVCGQYQ